MNCMFSYERPGVVPYAFCLHLLNIAHYSISTEASSVLFYSLISFRPFDKSRFPPAVYSVHVDCELSLHTFVF